MDTSIKLGICLSVHFLILSVFSFSSLIKQHDTFWIKTVLEGIKLAWQDKQTFIGFQLWKNERNFDENRSGLACLMSSSCLRAVANHSKPFLNTIQDNAI